jgi:hypothetical protein
MTPPIVIHLKSRKQEKFSIYLPAEKNTYAAPKDKPNPLNVASLRLGW